MEINFNYLQTAEEYKEMRSWWVFATESDFEAIFGYRNGARMNKILLSFITSRSVFDYSPYLIATSSMASMKRKCMQQLQDAKNGDLELMESFYKLEGYSTDERHGICVDADTNSIRIIKDGRLCKSRAGKLFRKIILASDFGKALPESVVTWLCEEFASDWNAWAQTRVEFPYKLVTGLNDNLSFADIYGNGSYYTGYLGSCMSGQHRDKFYTKSLVECFPAALVKKDNPKHIVCRCVVYTNVIDAETGTTYRLAERQYTNDDESMKRQLVIALKNAGLIDGYKAVGASCHDGRNFVLNDGTALDDKTLFVNLSFRDNKILSYQDSFKFYKNDEHKAYNRRPDFGYDISLDSTSPRVDIYTDSYHDCEVFNSVVNVWVNGKRMTCDEDNTRDFIFWQDSYYHREKDAKKCPHCGRMMGTHHIPDDFYSELTDETYCSAECKNAAEAAMGEAKMFFSAFDGDYVKKASELTMAYVFCQKSGYFRGDKKGYRRMSIKKTSLEALLVNKEAIIVKGKAYVGLNYRNELKTDMNGKPLMYPVCEQ